MANGMLTLGELKREIAAGTIDTVVAAMVDMQGRLIGKRFHAQFFADSGHEETHGCNYLLAVDIEMEPVPGYKATSWEKGYGDFVLKPDLATLRRIPWLPGTALVLCDVLDHHTHEDVPHSPRAMLKKQLKRLEAMKLQGLHGLGARVLPVRRQLRDRQPEGLPQPQDQRALHRGLPHPPDDQGRGRDAGHPQRPRTARASRSRTPRANGARARRRSTSTTPRRSRWPTGTPSSRTAARRSPRRSGKAITFMAKWDYGMAGSSSPHPPVAVVGGRQVAAVLRQGGRARHVGHDEALSRGPARACRRDHLFPGALHQLLQALHGRHLRADASRSGASTTAPPAIACAAPTPRHPRRMPGRRRRSQSLSRLRGAARRRPRRHREEDDARARVLGRRLRSREAAPRNPQDPARGEGAARRLDSSCAPRWATT